MAAAPADFRPASVAEQKIKKTDGGTPGAITLVENPDIAAELGAAKRPGQVLVAFAAETHDALENARGKLVRKRADLIVVNEVGVGLVFGQDSNTVTLLGADGFTATHGELPKDDVADMILDQVAARLDSQVGHAQHP
jgi:phosphopantothenoylcysteine decarboxylase/phosphopantothenate--cysteine ligase